MNPVLRSAALVSWTAALLFLLLIAPASAAPSFPKLTGRVVDEAQILSPQSETAMTEKLAALETSTGRQVVVVTLKDLQGYDIADYGYQLGRDWAIGSKEKNDGVLLIVAPTERKVRIEVGYGLEPILTDALSNVILQREVLPRFKAGDMEGGVVAGADAIIAQLSLDAETAQAKAQAAASAEPRSDGAIPVWLIVLIGFWIVSGVLRALFRGRRRVGRNGDWLIPWIIISSGSGRGGGWSGGGGGGGFSGGGGSFGGGGSSGSW